MKYIYTLLVSLLGFVSFADNNPPWGFDFEDLGEGDVVYDYTTWFHPDGAPSGMSASIKQHTDAYPTSGNRPAMYNGMDNSRFLSMEGQQGDYGRRAYGGRMDDTNSVVIYDAMIKFPLCNVQPDIDTSIYGGSSDAHISFYAYAPDYPESETMYLYVEHLKWIKKPSDISNCPLYNKDASTYMQVVHSKTNTKIEKNKWYRITTKLFRTTNNNACLGISLFVNGEMVTYDNCQTNNKLFIDSFVPTAKAKGLNAKNALFLGRAGASPYLQYYHTYTFQGTGDADDIVTTYDIPAFAIDPAFVSITYEQGFSKVQILTNGVVAVESTPAGNNGSLMASFKDIAAKVSIAVENNDSTEDKWWGVTSVDGEWGIADETGRTAKIDIQDALALGAEISRRIYKDDVYWSMDGTSITDGAMASDKMEQNWGKTITHNFALLRDIPADSRFHGLTCWGSATADLAGHNMYGDATQYDNLIYVINGDLTINNSVQGNESIVGYTNIISDIKKYYGYAEDEIDWYYGIPNSIMIASNATVTINAGTYTFPPAIWPEWYDDGSKEPTTDEEIEKYVANKKGVLVINEGNFFDITDSKTVDEWFLPIYDYLYLEKSDSTPCKIYMKDFIPSTSEVIYSNGWFVVTRKKN